MKCSQKVGRAITETPKMGACVLELSEGYTDGLLELAMQQELGEQKDIRLAI